MSEKYTPVSALVLLTLMVGGPFAHAQTPAQQAPITNNPNAGSLGNQLRQSGASVPQAPVASGLVLPSDEPGGTPLSAASQVQVTLSRVVLTGDVTVPGVDAINEARLQQVVQPWVGRALQFADIQAMADAVTRFYRQEGVLLARATLPPQTIKAGALTLHIVAGKYDAATIENATALKTTVVERMIAVTTPEGAVVHKKQLERVALLLNEVPGVKARVALKAGDKAGTTALDVAVEPGQRVGGYVGLDNQGDPTTGRSRVMLGGYANNLLGYGDLLRLDLLDAYEKSDLFNVALDYSALVNNGYGTRVGGNYSHLNYRYSLSQLSFSGYSDNWLLYLTQPWVRTETARADIRLDGGQQFLTDKYPYAANTEGRKRVSQGGLALSGSALTLSGGLSTLDLRTTVGQVDYRNDMAAEAANESGTAGAFTLLNYQLTHDQQVYEAFSGYASLRGQMASHNLDASQKFLLGGPTAVRAYDVGSGSVSSGNVFAIEARGRWGVPAQTWLGSQPSLTAAAFYDVGWGEQFKDNSNRVSGAVLTTSDNRFTLAGTGLYVTLADAGNYALTATWAHRTGEVDPVSGKGDQNRFWLTAVKTF